MSPITRKNAAKGLVLLTVIAGLCLSLVALPAWAADPTPTTKTYKGLSNAGAGAKDFAGVAGVSTATTSPAVIVGNIIYALLGLLGTVFVVLIVYSGFLYLTARGNEEQVTKAKKLILNSIIGIVIVLSAWTITGFVLEQLAKVETKSGSAPPAAAQ